MSGPALEIDAVSKRFRIYRERNQTLKSALMRGRRSVHEDFWALREVSIDIPEGSTYGLVGDNGSGKSTLLKCIARILRPDHGEIRATGRVAALLEVGSGFHPELSGRENVFLNGSILGMSRREIDRKFDDIVGFAGVGEFIDQPVKNYSSGMYVRLGFSVAINVDPDILLVDEILAVGDAAFQEKCTEKFADFRRDGRTVVIVSHALGTLRSMCDHAAWLQKGRLVEVGDGKPVIERYVDATHPDRSLDERGRTRWGSGEARLLDVELLRDGQPSVRFHTGEEMVIRLRYRADRRIDKPVFGLAMEAADGTYLWANNTRDAQWTPDSIEGDGVVECRIPRLMLQPGGFLVLASVVDWTTTHVYDFMRDAARFDVESGVPRESGGFLALDGRWSVRTDGGEPA